MMHSPSPIGATRRKGYRRHASCEVRGNPAEDHARRRVDRVRISACHPAARVAEPARRRLAVDDGAVGGGDPRGRGEGRRDLHGIELLGLRIGGGASQVDIVLPPPIGAVPVAIGGGASHLTVRRPAEVPVRLQIRGGASKLGFDEQSFGAIGGRTQLQSEGFREAADRYEITIGGGASHVTVSTL